MSAVRIQATHHIVNVTPRHTRAPHDPAHRHCAQRRTARPRRSDARRPTLARRRARGPGVGSRRGRSARLPVRAQRRPTPPHAGQDRERRSRTGAGGYPTPRMPSPSAPRRRAGGRRHCRRRCAGTCDAPRVEAAPHTRRPATPSRQPDERARMAHRANAGGASARQGAAAPWRPAGRGRHARRDAAVKRPTWHCAASSRPHAAKQRIPPNHVCRVACKPAQAHRSQRRSIPKKRRWRAGMVTGRWNMIDTTKSARSRSHASRRHLPRELAAPANRDIARGCSEPESPHSVSAARSIHLRVHFSGFL